jgi:hypothetical protein
MSAEKIRKREPLPVQFAEFEEAAKLADQLERLERDDARETTRRPRSDNERGDGTHEWKNISEQNAPLIGAAARKCVQAKTNSSAGKCLFLVTETTLKTSNPKYGNRHYRSKCRNRTTFYI